MKIINEIPPEMMLRNNRLLKENFWVSLTSVTKGISNRVIAGVNNRLLRNMSKSAKGIRGHANRVPGEKSLIRQMSIPPAVTTLNGMMYFLKDGFSGNEYRSFTDPQNEIR